MRRWTRRALAILFVLGIAGFRLSLPGLVRRRIDRILNEEQGYRGSVDRVRIRLWRGAYALEGLRFEKIGADPKAPLFAAQRLEFSIAWKPLVRGNLSAKIRFDRPQMNIVASRDRNRRQTDVHESWARRIEEMSPFRVDRFAIDKGELHFRNPDASPPVDAYLTSMTVRAYNLTNDKTFYKTVQATVDASAVAMSSGRLGLRMALNPLADKATFGVAMKLEGLQLPELNAFFRHYLAVEAKTGTLDFYLEGTAREGEFRGYAKPLLERLDVIKMKKKPAPLEAVKAGVVKLVGYAMKNRRKDRLGSRIEIAGTVAAPKPDAWSAIGSFFQNWIGRALDRGFENMKGSGS